MVVEKACLPLYKDILQIDGGGVGYMGYPYCILSFDYVLFGCPKSRALGEASMASLAVSSRLAGGILAADGDIK